MTHLPTNCPYCESAMHVTAMECVGCSAEIKGRFRSTLFQALGSEDQELLEQYLLVDFSIKDLASQSGMGYMAIRTRLDNMIANYRALKDQEAGRKVILTRIASGEITPSEGAELLLKLAGSDR